MDTISDNCVWTKEANDEIEDYLNSLASVINSSGKIVAGGNSSLIKRAIWNISS
jgi:chaperonin GroEL (HSP60 family)